MSPVSLSRVHSLGVSSPQEGTGRLKEPGKLKHPIARAFARDVCAAFLSLLIVLGTTIVHYGLLSETAWKTPPHYSRDGLIVLTVLHAAASGDYQPMRSFHPGNLGMPRRANWDGWPIYDPWLWKFGGALCHKFGLAVGANLLLLAAHAATALTMFVCLRLMRCTRLWAAVFAAALGLSPFLFRRGFNQLIMANTCAVPLICLAGHRLFRGGLSADGMRDLAFLLPISFGMGGVTPYYSAIYFGLIIAAGIYDRVRGKGARKSWPFAACGIAFLLGLIIQLQPTLRHLWNQGGDFIRLGSAFPMLSATPAGAGKALAESLGLLGGLAAVLVAGVLVHQARVRGQIRSGWLWLVALAFIAAFVTGATRIYSVLVLAGCYCFLGLHFSRGDIRLLWLARMLAAPLVVVAAVLGPVLHREKAKAKARSYGKSSSDAVFVKELEKSLPPDSLVFDFPALHFPRGVPFLRPALWSAGVRHSFGDLTFQDRKAGENNLAGLPAGEMLQRLEASGFRGVLVYNKEGVWAGEAKRNVDQFLKAAKSLGLRKLSDTHGDFVFFFIGTSARPQTLPPAADRPGSTVRQPNAIVESDDP